VHQVGFIYKISLIRVCDRKAVFEGTLAGLWWRICSL